MHVSANRSGELDDPIPGRLSLTLSHFATLAFAISSDLQAILFFLLGFFAILIGQIFLPLVFWGFSGLLAASLQTYILCTFIHAHFFLHFYLRTVHTYMRTSGLAFIFFLFVISRNFNCKLGDATCIWAHGGLVFLDICLASI